MILALQIKQIVIALLAVIRGAMAAIFIPLSIRTSGEQQQQELSYILMTRV